jgi:hypothetical protein
MNPPSAVSSPGDVTACDGAAVALTAAFEGTCELYVWETQEDGSGQWVVCGGDAPVLSLPVVTPEDDGAYRCTCINSCGQATTAPGSLTVYAYPVLVEEPQDTCARPGETAVLSAPIEAGGAGPAVYLWFKDGMYFDGPFIDDPELTLTNVQPSDAGLYVATIYFESACVTNSRQAELTVGDCCTSPGDLDDDGDVDLTDFARFQACFGPGGGLEAGCTCGDLNSDDDIDLADYGQWEAAFGGPAE